MNEQPDSETAALSTSSLEAIERGELPVEAQRRLKQETGGRRFFASDLSVDELLLVEREGFEPLGVVMGSSIYHMGWQFTSTWRGSSRELETVTAAHLHARALAMGRMGQEAAALGAQGVVGVRFTIKPYEDEPDLIEFAAIGTAVRRTGAALQGPPFVSDLSGEDFWALLQAGYEPLGLAMGYSSYYTFPFGFPYVRGAIWSYGNQELPAFSQCVYNARHLAMQRLESDLRGLGAAGITDVRIDVRRHLRDHESNNTTYLSLQVDFFAMGTAIRPRAGASAVPQPALLLNMTGLRPVRTPSGATTGV